MELVRNFTLVFVSFVCGLLFLELGIRGYDATRGYGFFSDHRSEIMSVPTSRPFRGFGPDHYSEQDGKRFIVSRHGELYPLEKPDGTVRIVVFGGSTSENSYAFETAGIHYPGLLQKRLRERLGRSDIEVISVANSAYAAPHSLILLELDVVSWNPDLIIVSHNINDLMTEYWPNFTLDYSNKYKHKQFGLPDLEKLYTPLNILFRRSQLYWVVKSRIDRIFRKPKENTLQRRSYGETPSPKSLEIFKRNLRSMIAIAKYNNIKVLLGTQPIASSEKLFDTHMKEKSYNDIVVYPLHEELLLHHSIFNDYIIKIAKEDGVNFVDNRLTIPDGEAYFIDFVHYTPAGVSLLAENYANSLLNSKLLAATAIQP